MTIGLRIDVDTFRGTRDGVPALRRILAAHRIMRIMGTFYFTVGPDNMGRHMWRMLRPAFAWKMLRTGAASTYGWDMVLRGTLWPGPNIGRKLRDVIRAAADDGHEIGLHAWDHHAWQMHIDDWPVDTIRTAIRQGFDALSDIVGRPVETSAAPGWRCNDRVLIEKAAFPFRYNSDCRGASIFRPVVDGRELDQPQVPVTLPTWDEAVGRDAIDDTNYNEHILSSLRPDRLNVLTIHAEVEGCSRAGLFERFIEMAHARGHAFVPLVRLLDQAATTERGCIVADSVPGRDGVVACQEVVPPLGSHTDRRPHRPAPSKGGMAWQKNTQTR